MDLDDINSDDESSEVPPAPSPPQLSSSDVYKSFKRSPSPDYRRQRRHSSSSSRSPSRSRFYRRSRSPDRERDRDRGRDRDRDSYRDRDRDRDRERHRDRDRNREKEREKDRDRDRDRVKDVDRDRVKETDRDKSRKYVKRDRSRSRSRSNSSSRSESKEKQQQIRSSKPQITEPPRQPKEKKSKSFVNQPPSFGHVYIPPVIQPRIIVQPNAFKNDGSFMEMFKKMQERLPVPEPQPTTSILEEKPVAPPPLMVGKRRGGRILKTGMVAKPKTEQTAEQPKDAWSLYMAEVKKYREVCCQEEDNTRPLVKALTVMPAAVETPKLGTVPFDPRFPNQNQTRYCYQMYLDFHRCSKAKGEGYKDCQYFKHAYQVLCPNAWVEKWDQQVAENRFPGNI